MENLLQEVLLSGWVYTSNLLPDLPLAYWKQSNATISKGYYQLTVEKGLGNRFDLLFFSPGLIKIKCN